MKNILNLGLLICLAACNQQHKTEIVAIETIQNSFNDPSEKLAVMKVIENETASFFKRDYENWKKYFIQEDYAFHAWNNIDGTIDARSGWKEVDEKIKFYINLPSSKPVNQKSMGQEPGVKETPSSHPKVIRKNMVTKNFSNTVLYLMWDQYNSEPDEKRFNYSKETRIMEKINGDWKIANVTSYWDFRRVIPAADVLP